MKSLPLFGSLNPAASFLHGCTLFIGFCLALSASAAALDIWHEREVPLLPTTLYRVTYGNGTFVAVDSENTVLRSINGVNWTRHAAPPGFYPSDGFSLSFANGRFFLSQPSEFGEEPPAFFTSTNGLAWTRYFGTAPRRVVFGNGVYVALAEGGVRVSNNGINWGTTLGGDNFYLSRVAFGNGHFVLVGNQDFPDFGYLSIVMTSPDGFNWTYTRIQENEEFYNLAVGNGLFVAEGSFGSDAEGFSTNILVSTDGITWTRHGRPVDFSYDFSALAFGGGVFVSAATFASNSLPAILSSADGITWQAHTVVTNEENFYSFYDLVYGLDTFVGVGEGPLLVQSDPLTNAPPAVPASLTLRQYPGITISGTLGATYAIEATSNLNQTNGWQAITNITLSSSPYLWVDVQSSGHRFYRAVAQ